MERGQVGSPPAPSARSTELDAYSWLCVPEVVGGAPRSPPRIAAWMAYYLAMPACCRAAPCEELFDARVAAWNLRAFRRGGLSRVQRQMLDTVPTEQVQRGRILEIGGGIGVLQAELLRRGAASGEVVELVSAYKPYAEQLADEVGVADRSTFHVLDLLGDPGGTQPANVVLLDKVICCSPEGLELIRLAAGLTRGTLVISFPRASWWMRLAARGQHALFRLLRRDYRFFVRPTAQIHAAATDAGLVKVATRRAALWEIATFTAHP